MRKMRFTYMVAMTMLVMVALALPASAASLGVSASTRPEQVEKAGNIEISLTLTNNSTTLLEDVTFITQNGTEKLLGDIQPGTKRTFNIGNFAISEEQIGSTITLTLEWIEDGDWMSTDYPLHIIKKVAEPKLSATRTVDPTSGRSGDTVKLNYQLNNTGNVRIKDISISDPIASAVIADGISLDPGESKTVSHNLVLEKTVQSKPVVTGQSEDGQVVQVEVGSLTITMMQPSLSITVMAGLAGDTGTDFDVHIVNDGNIELSQITLQDDKGVIIEDGLKLPAGEEVHYTHTISTAEEREVVVTATCFAEGMEEKLSFTSAGVALAPRYLPEDIIVNATALLDKTELSEPDIVAVQIELSNGSPVPVYNVVIAETAAGEMAKLDTLPVGKKTVEFDIQIIQAGQLNFRVDYEDSEGRPYSTTIPVIDIAMLTPQAKETPVPLPEKATNSNAGLLIVMAALALLVVLAFVTLIVLLIRQLGLSRRRREDEEAMEYLANKQPRRSSPQRKQDLRPQTPTNTQKKDDGLILGSGSQKPKQRPTQQKEVVQENTKTKSAVLPDEPPLREIKETRSDPPREAAPLDDDSLFAREFMLDDE